MNILFIGSSSDWHVDLWVQYFTDSHNVTLFSDKEDYLTNQSYEKVKVVESNGYFGWLLNFFSIKSHFLFQINKLLSAKKFSRHVDKVIGENNIDIVHAHSLYYGFLSSNIKSAVPIIFTPMGSDVILHAQSNRLYNFMARKSFKKSYIVTGDSLLLQKRGYNVGASKQRNYVIQNGVDSSLFYPNDTNLNVKYGIASDEVLIFSPRAITSIYNIDVIISSLKHLKDAGYKIKCMFSYAFGDEYTRKLLNQVSKLGLEENVIWLGYLSYADMADHYNVADIVVSIPSSDSSPKSVYEAMFCRKPIVISNLEWSHELLSDCECLMRIEDRNEVQLFENIESLINDSELAEELANNAYNVAKKYFDYEENMRKMEIIMIDGIKSYKRD